MHSQRGKHGGQDWLVVEILGVRGRAAKFAKEKYKSPGEASRGCPISILRGRLGKGRGRGSALFPYVFTKR